MEEKIHFLQNEFINRLSGLDANTSPVFGKMSGQQMVEHMAEYIRLAYGNPVLTLNSYPDEVIDKMRLFLQSEKPFRPNTPNPLMSETPPAIRHPDMQTAIEDLAASIQELFTAFDKAPYLVIHNPFFGDLDWPLTVQLLTKHAQHHLRQFALWT